MSEIDVTEGSDMAQRIGTSGRLGAEVRQSLSLIGMTALTLMASIAFGLFVGHLG